MVLGFSVGSVALMTWMRRSTSARRINMPSSYLWWGKLDSTEILSVVSKHITRVLSHGVNRHHI